MTNVFCRFSFAEYPAVQWLCPGCDALHCLLAPSDSELAWWRDGVDRPWGPQQSTRWQWNGSLLTPTVAPSIKHGSPVKGEGGGVCHYFIRNGMVEFCGDCTHRLAGQTVPLPAIEGPEWRVWERGATVDERGEIV